MKVLRQAAVFMGVLAAMGAFFIEGALILLLVGDPIRRRRLQIARADLRRVEQALWNGFDAAVFPEATSTDGEKVLPFKPAVFRAAAEAAAFVQPLHLRYESIDGRPIDARTRDLVCRYGDMTFVPHLWKLAGCRRITARLSVLEAFPGAGAEPRALSVRAHELVRRRHEDVGERVLGA